MSVFVVEVNEVLLYTYSAKAVAERWNMFRRCNPPDRFNDLVHSLAGNRVQVACDDRDHANWLVQHIASWGAPQSAARVRRTSPPLPAVTRADS